MLPKNFYTMPLCADGCPACVHCRNTGVELPLGADWRVRPEDALLESLREWLSPDGVEMIYA